jgi:hypothetical protein
MANTKAVETNTQAVSLERLPPAKPAPLEPVHAHLARTGLPPLRT